MNNISTQKENTNPDLYPAGLASWSGFRRGGVRIPFSESTGRPTGEQIETPVVKRLKDWANAIARGNEAPRVIILVGGPGNGKTDSIEGCINELDSALGANNSINDAFAKKFESPEGGLPPRKAVIRLDTYIKRSGGGEISTITLVQDATQGEPALGMGAEEALIKELNAISNGEHTDGIYLCCVNRGILARAASIAANSEEYSQALALAEEVTRSVTSGPEAYPCWPLKNYSDVAVWPMDVESLVRVAPDSESKSVAHQIFNMALKEERWVDRCNLSRRCPFCQNRIILTTRKGALDALIQFLEFYELSSGKRWTFRDLFSLVSYLLSGDYSEFEFNGKFLSPCEWAAKQLKLAGKANRTVQSDSAPYLLMSRLYHHRLFPLWPDFNRGEHWKAKQQVLKGDSAELAEVRGLFRFLSKIGDYSSLASGDVPKLVRESFCPAIDPALATGNLVLSNERGTASPLTVDNVEEMFSLSVSDGKNLVQKRIEALEQDVLNRLELADAALLDDKFPRNRTRQARLLQGALRQFAARLVKRSLGSKIGTSREKIRFEGYQNAILGGEELKSARKQLRKLLHEHDNSFRAALATTFGQPIAERSRNVTLLLQKNVKVTSVKNQATERRPKELLPYFIVERNYTALTYELYRALKDVADGLHDASLPGEIYSLLDRVRSLVSGQVVRDTSILEDEPSLVIGSAGDIVEAVDDAFHFERGNESK